MQILIFHQIFLENAIIMSKILNVPLANNFEPIDNEIYIIFGAHEKPVELYEIQRTHKIKYIIFNTESHESTHFKNKYYIKLLMNNYVFNYSQQISNYLLSVFNIKTISNFNFYFLLSENTINRLYKVGFIGNISDKRTKILNEIKEIAEMNILIDFENKNNNPEDMKKTLNQCHWIINIPYYNHKNFEKHRINNALSCGCQVVSLRDSMDEETIKEYEPYIFITSDLVAFFKNPPTYKKKSWIEFFNNRKNKDLIKQNIWAINKIKYHSKL